MCSTCTTAFDALSTNAVLVGAVAANTWERVRDRRDGRSRLERAVQRWETDAAFMRSMGLDPLATLGAPPAPPVPAPTASGRQ